MLNAVLHAHLNEHNTPISGDMKENLYIDNIITGCESHNEALNYYEEVRGIMADAKFNLRSWASNSKALRDRAAVDKVLVADCDDANVLGLRWNTLAGTLALVKRETSQPPDAVITKQEILSV